MYIGPTSAQKLLMKSYHLDNDRHDWDLGLTLIGLKVCKKSGRPFKSGEKIGTVKDVVRNPNTSLWAVSFNEDDSVVDIKQIKLASDYNGR